jgi:hypothetical protein
MTADRFTSAAATLSACVWAMRRGIERVIVGNCFGACRVRPSAGE